MYKSHKVIYPKCWHNALREYTGDVMTFDELHREQVKRDKVRSGWRFAIWLTLLVVVAIYGGWL